MKYCLPFSIMILMSCNSHENVNLKFETDHLVDSTSYSQYIAKRQVKEVFTDNVFSKIERENDSTIIGALKLLEYWYEEDFPNFGLLDWNQDGHNDLFFEYYASCGTGVKFRVDVYLYDETTKQFKDEDISFMNPSYYYDQGIITSHYLGHGGGFGAKYKVEDGIFDTLEWIHVDINDYYNNISVDYQIEDFEKSTSIKLTDTIIYLPSEYGYNALIYF